jgi:hypothetical protein
MPATSAKQKRFMDAAAHNPDFAKQAGINVLEAMSLPSWYLKDGENFSITLFGRKMRSALK